MSTAPAVLVTGGAGYSGSQACKALKAAGYLPICFDNLSTGHEWSVKWGPLEFGDVRDEGAVRVAMQRHNVTSVMHFAAHSLVGESAIKPADYYGTNVGGVMAIVSPPPLNGTRSCPP